MHRFVCIFALLLWPLVMLANLPRHTPQLQLTKITHSGSLGAPATSVTVNGQPAEKYADFTFARTNNSLTGNDPFTVIAQNQFRSVTNTLSTTLPASVTLTWDTNGNLTSDGTRVFFYDALNRVTNVTVQAQWKVEFLYDGVGRRRVMREYGWQGSGWGTPTNETRYLYDGMLPIQERNGANAILATYTRGLDLTGTLQGAGGIGGLLARTASGEHLFYHSDAAGNITALLDQQGRIEARYEYGAFGRLVGKWGPLADVNPFTFSSKSHIPHAEDLYDFGRRYWLSGLQRWGTRDPLAELGDLNLYRGMFNSPLNFVDRDGGDNLGVTGYLNTQENFVGTVTARLPQLPPNVPKYNFSFSYDSIMQWQRFLPPGPAPGPEMAYDLYRGGWYHTAGLQSDDELWALMLPFAARPLNGMRPCAAKTGADSALQGARLGEHLRQLEKYGQAGFKELESGRIRYYGNIDPATTPGTMAGRRLVREWDPSTGAARTWHETVDQAGRVRIVRPETGGSKVHYMFDEHGNYTGSF